MQSDDLPFEKVNEIINEHEPPKDELEKLDFVKAMQMSGKSRVSKHIGSHHRKSHKAIVAARKRERRNQKAARK